MKNVNDSTATRVVCAILFLTFTFVFLYCYEGDMLVVAQHIASGGQTHYEYLIGATLLTLFLFLVQWGAAALTRLRGIFHAVTYFPSLIILTFLVSTPTSEAPLEASYEWMWQLPLLLAVWGVAAWMACRYQKVEMATRHAGILTQLTFINVCTLAAFMLIPCLVGNADRRFHQRIHQEYLITHARYDEALRLGQTDEALNQAQNDEALKLGQPIEQRTLNQTMVNAYCMSRLNILPDSLFAMDIPEGMTTLLPSQQNGHFLLTPDSTALELKNNRDVLLCQRLLKRQLPQFAERLGKWYKRRNNLPRHYHEALALCRQLHPAMVAEYQADKADSLLLDFQRLRQANIQDTLRSKYAHTYWFYFYRQ